MTTKPAATIEKRFGRGVGPAEKIIPMTSKQPTPRPLNFDAQKDSLAKVFLTIPASIIQKSIKNRMTECQPAVNLQTSLEVLR